MSHAETALLGQARGRAHEHALHAIMSIRPHGLGRRRPQVALVSWHTSPLAAPGVGRAGGMNVYVRELAAALITRGADVDIVTAAPGATKPRMCGLAPGLRLIALPRADAALVALPRYDVVHSHYWQSAAVADALVRHSRARHVHTFHTLGAVKNAALAPGEAGEPAHRLVAERAIAARADAIVVATNTERAQLLAVTGAAAQRVHVVAPGVDLARFAPRPALAARASLGLGPGLLIVLAGRLQPLKGVDLAIRALGRLAPELRERCVLAVAGGQSGPAAAESVAALRHEARQLPPNVSVALLGRLDPGTLALLWCAADVAVMPSRTESFGLAALEAHACGTPVVGTAVGGLPDIVRAGESGYLVARDPGSLARRLGDVLDATAPARRRMRAAAVESARRFSWARTAAGVAAAYEL